MKVSELIELLEKAKEEHGDLECIDLTESGNAVSAFDLYVSDDSDSLTYKTDFFGKPMPEKWLWVL